MRGFTATVAGGWSPSDATRTPLCGSRVSDGRDVAAVLRFGAPSSERWRAGARYALLGTVLLTSPILLPFVLALLMLVLHGTPLGAAILERLHLVYIWSVVYCLVALAIVCLPAARHRTRRDRRA